MGTFEINGGKRLSGELKPQGAKNESIANIMCSFIKPRKITIKNLPDIIDVNKLIDLLKTLRYLKVEKLDSETYSFKPMILISNNKHAKI